MFFFAQKWSLGSLWTLRAAPADRTRSGIPGKMFSVGSISPSPYPQPHTLLYCLGLRLKFQIHLGGVCEWFEWFWGLKRWCLNGSCFYYLGLIDVFWRLAVDNQCPRNKILRSWWPTRPVAGMAWHPSVNIVCFWGGGRLGGMKSGASTDPKSVGRLDLLFYLPVTHRS